jgi:DNA-binding response OmpR family regulator
MMTTSENSTNAPDTILLVDDNPSLLEQLGMRLESAGYRVLQAQDGIEALDILSGDSVDLILADIAMPRLNGYQLIQRVRANPVWIGIPIVVLTARTLDSDIRFGKELGVDDYLSKPVHPEDLLAVVRGKILRARQLNGAYPKNGQPAPIRQNMITIGDLKIDADQHRVTRGGEIVPLSAREFKLLHTMAKKPGCVLSPVELVATTHGFQADTTEASAIIRPMVRTLRRKLGFNTGDRGCVENVRGVGYRLLFP